MPPDSPNYSKLIYVSYDDNSGLGHRPEIDLSKSEFYGTLIYQRLRYAGFPVRTHAADTKIGGGGGPYHSINVASPMIAIVHGNSDKLKGSIDIQDALGLGKEILAVKIDDAELPMCIRDCTVIDYSNREGEEAAFQQLKSRLQKREYPAPKYVILADGDRSLNDARHWHKEFVTSDAPDKSKFLHEYFYLSVFADLTNRKAKIEALRDFGRYQIMSGLIVAALLDDPHDDVRAQAALELAKFPDFRQSRYLYSMSKKEHPQNVALYAHIAYLQSSDSTIVGRLIRDLETTFPNRESSADSDSAGTDGAKLGQKHTPPAEENESDVFISYARKDGEKYAIDLATRLRQEGVKVWTDFELKPGTRVWSDAIENAIIQARIVVVLLSPAVHDSVWVKREYTFAEEHQKLIVPITTIKTNKPLGLTTGQSLRGDPIYSENAEQVVDSLVQLLRGKS